MTTREFYQSITAPERDVPVALVSRGEELEKLLHLMDQVKFARYVPRREELEDLYTIVYSFIDSTSDNEKDIINASKSTSSSAIEIDSSKSINNAIQKDKESTQIKNITEYGSGGYPS